MILLFDSLFCCITLKTDNYFIKKVMKPKQIFQTELPSLVLAEPLDRFGRTIEGVKYITRPLALPLQEILYT